MSFMLALRTVSPLEVRWEVTFLLSRYRNKLRECTEIFIFFCSPISSSPAWETIYLWKHPSYLLRLHTTLIILFNSRKKCEPFLKNSLQQPFSRMFALLYKKLHNNMITCRKKRWNVYKNNSKKIKAAKFSVSLAPKLLGTYLRTRYEPTLRESKMKPSSKHLFFGSSGILAGGQGMNQGPCAQCWQNTPHAKVYIYFWEPF